MYRRYIFDDGSDGGYSEKDLTQSAKNAKIAKKRSLCVRPRFADYAIALRLPLALIDSGRREDKVRQLRRQPYRHIA
jgi:hypothetical protein